MPKDSVNSWIATVVIVLMTIAVSRCCTADKTDLVQECIEIMGNPETCQVFAE